MCSCAVVDSNSTAKCDQVRSGVSKSQSAGIVRLVRAALVIRGCSRENSHRDRKYTKKQVKMKRKTCKVHPPHMLTKGKPAAQVHCSTGQISTALLCGRLTLSLPRLPNFSNTPSDLKIAPPPKNKGPRVLRRRRHRQRDLPRTFEKNQQKSQRRSHG